MINKWRCSLIEILYLQWVTGFSKLVAHWSICLCLGAVNYSVAYYRGRFRFKPYSERRSKFSLYKFSALCTWSTYYELVFERLLFLTTQNECVVNCRKGPITRSRTHQPSCIFSPVTFPWFWSRLGHVEPKCQIWGYFVPNLLSGRFLNF